MARSKPDWAAVEQLYFTTGKSLRDVAKTLGVPPATVLTRAKRENWKERREALLQGELPSEIEVRREEERPEEGTDVVVEAAEQPAVEKAVARRSPGEGQENALTVIAREGESYRLRMAEQAKRLPEIMEAMDDRSLVASADKLDKLDRLNRRSLNLDGENEQQPLIQIQLLGQVDEFFAEKEAERMTKDE